MLLLYITVSGPAGAQWRGADVRMPRMFLGKLCRGCPEGLQRHLVVQMRLLRFVHVVVLLHVLRRLRHAGVLERQTNVQLLDEMSYVPVHMQHGGTHRQRRVLHVGPALLVLVHSVANPADREQPGLPLLWQGRQAAPP